MEKGLSYTSTLRVDEAHTARTMGSGDMPVLATPALVALMENAAMKAVADVLPEGSTSVGALIEISHVKPSGVGEQVRATAELMEIEGRKLTFTLRAEDSKGEVGHGRHVRYIVDRQRFLAKL